MVKMNRTVPDVRALLPRLLLVGVVSLSLAIGLSGCEKKRPPAGSMAPAQVGSATAHPSVATLPAVENALEQAHQEYQVAYDKYVKMLRESGPQTLDTLNALADYQKKYQLYQRMLSDTQGGNGVASGR